MKKVLLIVRSEELKLPRTKRMIEEFEKRDCQVRLLCSSNLEVFIDQIKYNGRKIDFSKVYSVLVLGNTALHHFLIKTISFLGKVKVWPNKKSIVVDDKFIGGAFFHSIGIPTPKTLLLGSLNSEFINKAVKEIGGYPCVVKRVVGSRGVFIDLAYSAEEVIGISKKTSKVDGSFMIMQEYIKEASGEDIRVLCLRNSVIGVIKRESQNGDFRANLSLGGVAKKCEVPEEVKEYALKIMNSRRMFYAGIDFVKSKRGYLALEINSSASFTGFEKVTGINVAEIIVEEILK